jgi:hypothetical protein
MGDQAERYRGLAAGTLLLQWSRRLEELTRSLAERTSGLREESE